MAHLQYVDELVREYLLFRGFSGTLKIFDAELKTDKDKGFRVDKLVDQITQHIFNYDLTALRELWAHLDHKIFSRLEQDFTPAVRKLENAVLKMYVVNAVTNGKSDKLNEFFTRLAPDLQGQGEWKDWFLIPFVKNPEESPNFSVHFTRQWQDTLLVSLHNFLATIFQVMPLPTLANLEQEASKVKRLQEENESLRHKLTLLMDIPGAASVLAAANNATTVTGTSMGTPGGAPTLQDVIPPEVPPQPDLIDDFYVIAQDGGASHQTSGESQAKTLKSIIRNIGGLPSSPIMGRKISSTLAQPTHSTLIAGSKSKVITPSELQHKRSSSKQRLGPARNSPNVGSEAPSSTRVVSSTTAAGRTSVSHRSRTRDHSSEGISSKQPTTPPAGAFLLLSQEHYLEHKTTASHCHFNTSGTMVASADTDGVIKVWDAAQTLRTVSSFHTKSPLLAVDWVAKHDRYFMAANSNGSIWIFDSQDSRTLWEMNGDNCGSLKSQRLVNLACSPVEPVFLCSASPAQGQCKLLLFDIKTKQLQRSLSLNGNQSLVANCFAFNHNGQLVAVGCSDGSVQVFDIRRGLYIDSWPAHSGPALAVQLTPDDTACYTAGSDNKLCGRSMTQSGQVLCETTIPDLASPYQVSSSVPFQPTQLFSFHQSGSHALIRCSGGAVVFQVGARLEKILELQSSVSPTVALDWASANQCSTCLNAHANGNITVSTLLTP